MDSAGTRLSPSLSGMFWSVLRVLPSHPPPRMPIFGVSSPNLCQRQLCVVPQLYRLLLPLTTCCLLVYLPMLGLTYALVPHLPYSGRGREIRLFLPESLCRQRYVSIAQPVSSFHFPRDGVARAALRLGFGCAVPGTASSRTTSSIRLPSPAPCSKPVLEGRGPRQLSRIPPLSRIGLPAIQRSVLATGWASGSTGLGAHSQLGQKQDQHSQPYTEVNDGGCGKAPSGGPDQRWELTQAQGDEVQAGYNRILRPLACLGEGGLAHFYADLVWPWIWKASDDFRLDEEGGHKALWDGIRSKEEVLNEDAERFILGDRCRRDSQKRKREEDRPWQMSFLPGDC